MADQPTLSPSTYGSKGDPSKDIGIPANGDGPWPGQAGKENETELVRKFWKVYEERKGYKHGIVNPKDWKRYVLLYGDQHWEGSQEDWQSTPTINMIKAAIHAILPIVTDNRPQVAILPREPDDVKICNVLRAVIEWLWEENDCDVKLPTTMLNTLIFGNGFWKIFWDPSMRGGLGDICIHNVDPSSMFFNPEATSIRDATEVWHIEQMSMDWIKRNYPEKADEVKAGVQDPSIIINRPHLPQMGARENDTVSVQTSTGTDGVWEYAKGAEERSGKAPGASATVGECWKLDPDSGRWRRTVVANRVLLVDELTDLELAPFVHFVDYPVGWTLWATGEVQAVESLQRSINERRGMVHDILKHCSMPMMVVDPASGVDWEAMEARPNLVIPAEGGPSAVGILAPQMDLSGLFNLNNMDKQDFNDILGNVDINMGKRPVGIEAAAALEVLAEQANMRLRLKVRLMEASLRRAGMILVKMIQKHYTGMRIFRIVGREFTEDGESQAPEFFSINKPAGTEIGPDGQETPSFDGSSNHIPPDAEFDVRIGAGSTLPVSRTARFQQAITLFDRGAIDRKELLKSSAWPRWEEVEARMAQQEQMQQMAAMGGMGEMGEPQVPGSVQEIVNQGLPPEEEPAF